MAAAHANLVVRLRGESHGDQAGAERHTSRGVLRSGRRASRHEGRWTRTSSITEPPRMDPNNPVVRLCAQGIEVEMKGRRDEARSLFLRAWELRQDDVDACVAAHYVARHQETPAETLRWNELALTHAISASADSIRSFYPSLYLNLGKSYEDLGDTSRARELYEQGEQCIKDLPDSGYGEIVRQGLHNALQRVRREGGTLEIDAPTREPQPGSDRAGPPHD
jgi:tetratricopeptide (TPR) repeat protein